MRYFSIILLLVVSYAACVAKEQNAAAAATEKLRMAKSVQLPDDARSTDDLTVMTGGDHSVAAPGTGRKKAVRARYHTVTEQGDTVLMVVLTDITVFPELKFKNKKQEKFYWRTVRDVKKALPYAKLICETLLETYEYMETFPTQAEREAYLKEMEGAVFNQYKPALKKFTRSQARVLVKLIQRETDQSGYDLLKAFLGSFRATFWQGFGRLFGVNLKGKYDPAHDSNDAIIERVCVAVEQGQL